MIEQATQIQAEALAAVEAANTEATLEEARVKFLGKKSPLNALAGEMRNLSNEEKPKLGAALNSARHAIGTALDTRKQSLQDAADAASVEGLDPSMPGRSVATGSLHPLTIVKDRAIQILRRLGFALADGPEIETEFHCFDALNTPADHPARNDSDTFYFDSGKLLRTHTSSVQVRTMEKQTPPVKIIAPGSAYRRDEIDATGRHHLRRGHTVGAGDDLDREPFLFEDPIDLSLIDPAELRLGNPVQLKFDGGLRVGGGLRVVSRIASREHECGGRQNDR